MIGPASPDVFRSHTFHTPLSRYIAGLSPVNPLDDLYDCSQLSMASDGEDISPYMDKLANMNSMGQQALLTNSIARGRANPRPLSGESCSPVQLIPSSEASVANSSRRTSIQHDENTPAPITDLPQGYGSTMGGYGVDGYSTSGVNYRTNYGTNYATNYPVPVTQSFPQMMPMTTYSNMVPVQQSQPQPQQQQNRRPERPVSVHWPNEGFSFPNPQPFQQPQLVHQQNNFGNQNPMFEQNPYLGIDSGRASTQSIGLGREQPRSIGENVLETYKIEQPHNSSKSQPHGRKQRVRAAKLDSLHCRQCSKTFKRQSELNKHALNHTKPETCDELGCDATFPTRKDVVRHKATTHKQGKVVYLCPISPCKLTNPMNRKDNMRKHIRDMHKSEMAPIEQRVPGSDINAQDALDASVADFEDSLSDSGAFSFNEFSLQQ